MNVCGLEIQEALSLDRSGTIQRRVYLYVPRFEEG